MMRSIIAPLNDQLGGGAEARYCTCCVNALLLGSVCTVAEAVPKAKR